MSKLTILMGSVVLHLFILQMQLADIHPSLNTHHFGRHINVILTDQSLPPVIKKKKKTPKKTNQILSQTMNSGITRPDEVWSPVISPLYPRISRIKGHQGLVEIEYHIDPSGNWIFKRIIKGSGFQELDDSALEAMEVNRLRLPRQSTRLIAFNFSLR